MSEFILNREHKFTTISVTYFIFGLFLFKILQLDNINGVMTLSFDFNYFTLFKVLAIILMLIIGCMIPFYEYSYLNKFKIAFGILRRIAPYGSIFLVLLFYPFVDSKISAIVHDNASFFPYARYYVVTLYIISSILLITSVYLFFVWFLLIIKALLRFNAYCKGSEKVKDYIAYIRLLFYIVIIFISAYLSFQVPRFILFSSYNNIYVEKIIVFTSYGQNTACLNSSGKVFSKPINYLDQERISIMTPSDTGYNNHFKSEKCVRN